MYLVDTNIFLEVMLGRRRKEECKKFLALLRNGRLTGVVTDFTIHSIIVLFDRLEKRNELRVFLSSLSAYKGLYIYTTTISEELKAIDLAEGKGLDMDDAIQYSSALSLGARGIVSFDRDFDGLDLPRLEPHDLISERS